MFTTPRAIGTGVALAMSVSMLAACSGGDDGDGPITLNLATVNNPQMKDMEKLKSVYEDEHPGVKINFQVMEESDLRSAVTADVAADGGQYDLVTIGAYETPQWGANGWLEDLTPFADDADYD
ncbi:MAG: extracellular solute-binding protein, partial [Aquihabitans sp.]